MKFILMPLLLLITSVACADSNVVLSTGVSSTSSKPFNPLGEWDNKSTNYSLRYEGERFGFRWDKSVNGDDDGNEYATVDLLARPFKYMIVGGGVMQSHAPLRGTGRIHNFHAMIGLESPTLFSSFGAGVWFDHWSNGHIHQIVGWDGVPNPPRNVISIGLIAPFSF